ncbi:transmembrane 4 L6 family member 1-like isoform X3 [Petromyzon marinus]|uniref:transmembrane 4 L6 family member 1-like isoform X3 n=1 Tax=Petromyzon marinus TaxID=7757 RepID=UPI003F719B0A
MTPRAGLREDPTHSQTGGAATRGHRDTGPPLRYNMCTGKLSERIAVALWPLAILSILANLLLFFPNWQTMWASSGHLSNEVWYFHGFLGAGLLILLPANAAKQAGRLGGCMGGRFKMLGSVIFGVVGLVGSGYCVIVSAVALDYGPYC